MQVAKEKYSDTDLGLENIGNEKLSDRSIAHSEPQRVFQLSHCVDKKLCRGSLEVRDYRTSKD